MPRNSIGVYTLASASFTAGTVIASAAVNSNFSDIATALTQSLASTGVTPMTGSILGFAGTAAAPSYTFNSSPTVGFYLSAANEISVAAASNQIAKFNATGITMVGAASNIVDKNGGIIYGLPVGTIAPYGGTTAPALWLLCSGASVSQTTYALLYAVVGLTFGAPGGGNFNLPDLRGRGPYGKDDMGGTAANRITNAGSGITGTTLGASGGGQNITILQANLPNVNLTVTDPQHLHTYTTIGGAGTQLGTAGGGAYTGVPSGSSSTGITVASGGSGTALASMNPALIVNYIIFAGV